MKILILLCNRVHAWLEKHWALSNCPACGHFTPTKMWGDGVCLFCEEDRINLYNEVGWRE